MKRIISNKVFFSLILFTIFCLAFIYPQNVRATIEDGDYYRSKGLYQEAIKEYKKYEDFYNYYLLRNINNSELYREYSKLLADVLLRIAETYFLWDKLDYMKLYCNKIIFLSKKIGADSFIDPIRIRAEYLLKNPYAYFKKYYPDSSFNNDSSTNDVIIQDDALIQDDTDNNNDTEENMIDVVISPAETDNNDVLDMDISEIADLTEEDYMRIELEDEQVLLEESALTDEELNETLSEINMLINTMAEEEDTQEHVSSDNSQDEDTESNIVITEPLSELKLVTEQKSNPVEGPASSQLLLTGEGENLLVIHLACFSQELENRIEKPAYVSIDNGNMITSIDNDVRIESLTTEEVRIYLTIYLTEDYTIKQLNDLSNSIIYFILSIPPGYHVFLTLFNEITSEPELIEVNSDNLSDIMSFIKPSKSSSFEDFINKTYTSVKEHDYAKGVMPRFNIIINDEPEKVGASLSNKANEVSIPIYFFSPKDYSISTEMILKRITNNTIGTYSYGGFEPDLRNFLHSIALYLVQSTFLIKWENDIINKDDDLLINVDFVYSNDKYNITFDTSLIP